MKIRSQGCTTILVVPEQITFQFDQSDRSTVMTLWLACQEDKLNALLGGSIRMIFENTGLRRMIGDELCAGYVPKRVLSPDDEEFYQYPRAVLLGDFLLRK